MEDGQSAIGVTPGSDAISVFDPGGAPGNLDGSTGFATGQAVGNAVVSAFNFLAWLPYIIGALIVLAVANELRK
jgi:hypothetical protein